jgi:hypothetical protein
MYTEIMALQYKTVDGYIVHSKITTICGLKRWKEEIGRYNSTARMGSSNEESPLLSLWNSSSSENSGHFCFLAFTVGEESVLTHISNRRGGGGGSNRAEVHTMTKKSTEIGVDIFLHL